MSQIIPVSPNPNNPFHTFNFGDLPIRIILNADSEPLFLASDICKALEIANSRDAMARLDDDEKDVVSTDTPGGTQEMTYITEPGLFTLVLTSRKENAKIFKRWITHEVIPSIRKTGAYIAKPMTQAEMLVMHAQAFLAHEQRLAAIEQTQEHIQAQINARNEYFTVLAYCRIKHLPAPTKSEAQSYGRRCSALSRERGYEMGEVLDERHGTIHSYHESILAEVIGG